MEELNKNQIVLLTLLVSFVTSIATGIVTVTLMDQAPPAVTQTINRIVERTVEKVVPKETQVSTVIKEVPVIVTEEELIVKATNQGTKAMARIAEAGEKGKFLGSGFLITGGRILTSSMIFGAEATSTGVLEAILADGERRPLERLTPLDGSPLLVFRLAEKDVKPDWPVLELSAGTSVIGQTVIALGASDSTGLSVAVGIISSFLSSGTTTAPMIMTNAASPDNVGGPLLNIKGEVVGVNHTQGLAIPMETIAALIKTAAAH
ncbi:MAG: trypsin-like peptidase domain-containing protein [Candidatus Vogelbacteria bacterium]|nr:trypsin-like peptidase domain-containing protein [Candidatus Vogelbacteria bacterium]